MFKPTAKLKKILVDYNSHAYIYHDGIVIREYKEIIIENGTPTRIDVWHIVPCDIYLRGWDYNNDRHQRINVTSLYVGDTTLIANGLESVEIALNSGSQYSKELGLTINHITFENGAHRWHERQIVGVIHSQIRIGVDDTINSITEYVYKQYQSGNSIVVYGDLPEKKQTGIPVDLPVTTDQQ